MPRRIALEASGVMRSRPTGIAAFGHGLIQALHERSPGRYTLIHPLSRSCGRGALGRAHPGLALRAYLGGARLARSFALVHALDTRWPRRYGGPFLATLFDVFSALPISAEAGFSTAEFRRKKLEYYAHMAQRAQLIAAISEDSRMQFLERFTPRCPVVVISPGLDAPVVFERAEALALLRCHGISPPFVLTVGALCPRKNLEGAVAAYQIARRDRPELKLVLVGAPEASWAGSRGEAAVRAAGSGVHLLGYLERRSLWAAYNVAEAVVHLSHYEGFGLTVLEALAAGAPVLASSRGGIPEAAGGAAWLVDPGDPDQCAVTLRSILDRPGDLETRRRAGIAQARQYTWARAAAAAEQYYRELLGE